MTFQEGSELVNDALKGIEVKLVQYAKVLHCVPLHPPLLVMAILGHLDSLRNESIL